MPGGAVDVDAELRRVGPGDAVERMADDGGEEVALGAGEQADVDVRDRGGALGVVRDRLLVVDVARCGLELVVRASSLGPGLAGGVPVIRDVELPSAAQVVERDLVVVFAGRVHRGETLVVGGDLALGTTGLVVLKVALDVVDLGLRQRVARRSPAVLASSHVAREPAEVLVGLEVALELDVVSAAGERQVQELDDAGVLGPGRLCVVGAPASRGSDRDDVGGCVGPGLTDRAVALELAEPHGLKRQSDRALHPHTHVVQAQLGQAGRRPAPPAM